ncbi:unnamed protein product [Ilex paraguariensis]|uniref:Uncharacterized protein n=1 Tax=Ilex paraguariensis TaxID=185542 RepID=A0ABC8RY36_9AQUA
MSDWGPVFVAVVLFILLTPGLLIQVPGPNRCIEFGNFQTSGMSILVHSILYFALICIFLLAVGIHILKRNAHNCFLRIEMDIKYNKEQNKKQTTDNSVQQYGGYSTGFHFQEINRPMLPRKLKDLSWRQKCKQRCSFEWSELPNHSPPPPS